MDAIDASIVRFSNSEFQLVQYQQTAIPKATKQALRAVNTKTALAEIAALDVTMGELFATAALALIKANDLSNKDIHAIGSHGQTVLHLASKQQLQTIQIGDPNIIAYQTGITTIADFRRMDIAAGGEGAPLAPAFHQWLLPNQDRKRVVVNLGGMANITLLPGDKKSNVIGFDTGPANTLMDEWTQKHLHENFDKDGCWAKSGQCQPQLLATLLDEDYFKADPPKSTGKDLFNLQWLNKKLLQSAINIEPNHVQATLLELSVVSVSNAIQAYATEYDEILVCGGGVHNTAMMARLIELNPATTIKTTATYGCPPDAVEAVTFAWLAKCRLEEKPSNLISVTGADKQVLLGAIYQASRY